METKLVARPKKPKQAPADTGAKTIAFRCSGPYAAWVDRLAEHNRTTVAGTLDQALARFAREIGFNEPPPVR